VTSWYDNFIVWWQIFSCISNWTSLHLAYFVHYRKNKDSFFARHCSGITIPLSLLLCSMLDVCDVTVRRLSTCTQATNTSCDTNQSLLWFHPVMPSSCDHRQIQRCCLAVSCSHWTAALNDSFTVDTLCTGPLSARVCCGISPPRFLAERRKMQLNQGSFVCFSALCLVSVLSVILICLLYFPAWTNVSSTV